MYPIITYQASFSSASPEACAPRCPWPPSPPYWRPEPQEERARNCRPRPSSTHYFAWTALVAEPPRLLRTVMFCGFTGHENWPVYLPPPLLASVPISPPVEVTKTCNVALALVLVASTFKILSATLYSASVTATVSAGVAGDTVSVAVLVRPPNVAEIVTDVDAVTVLVVTVNVALLLPAGTVMLGGTVAAAVLLLESVTAAPPAGAAPLNVTVPTEDEPAITLVGFNVSAVSVTAVGGGVGWEMNSVLVTHWPPKQAERLAAVLLAGTVV